VREEDETKREDLWNLLYEKGEDRMDSKRV
jgi:hypothetical protein